MATKYPLVFTKEEREWLEEFTRRGRNSAANYTGKGIVTL
jgi:hypothetical protein